MRANIFLARSAPLIFLSRYVHITAGILTSRFLILLRHEPRADIMSKAAENDTLLPAQSAEPAVSQDVDEMIAEAKAVDAHFERARHRALNFASAVAAYLLPRPDGPKADLDRSGDKPSG
jgi:hypothetical protein